MGYSIFRLYTLLVLFTLSLYGEIYVLSYKVVLKNNLIASDSLYIAPLMVPSKKFKSIGFIELEGERVDSDRYIIQKNRDYILETLFKRGIIINDYTTNRNFSSTSQTTVILPPIYIALERGILENNLIILQEWK